MRACDAGTGSGRWLRRIGPTESSPLVARGTVYVGDWEGRVWPLDARTGRTHWVSQLQGAIKGALALSGRPIYIGTYAVDVVVLAARTGRGLVRRCVRASIYATP